MKSAVQGATARGIQMTDVRLTCAGCGRQRVPDALRPVLARKHLGIVPIKDARAIIDGASKPSIQKVEVHDYALVCSIRCAVDLPSDYMNLRLEECASFLRRLMYNGKLVEIGPVEVVGNGRCMMKAHADELPLESLG